jgi:hypothetical protein
MSVARSYHDKSGGAPWSNWVLNCDLAQGDRLPEKYVRVGLPAGDLDLKTYDVGKLHVCTEGITAATVGYLEVEYVVDLMTPQIQDPVGGSILYGSDPTHIFLTTTTIDSSAVMPFTTSAGLTMTFYQSWEGLIVMQSIGTVLVSMACAATGTSGSAVASAFTTPNAAGTLLNSCFRVRALPGTVLTFAPTATTLTSTYLSWATAAYASLNYSDSVATPQNASSVSSASKPTAPVYSPPTSSSLRELTQSMIDEVVAVRKKH